LRTITRSNLLHGEMKIWFTLLLALLLYTSSFAQNSPELSVGANSRALLEASIDHTNDVVYDTYLSSPDAARNLAEKALLQSEKVKYPVGIARSYFNIGIIYWSQSYYPIALFYQNTALANVPPNHPRLLAQIYSIMGRTYADLKDYKRAFYYLNKSQLLAGNDGNYLGETIGQEAYVYMKLQQYDKAIQKAKLSLKLNQSVNEKEGAAIIYSRLADLYYLKKDYPRSLAYNDTAYRESIKLNMTRLRAGMYLNYAVINNDRHQFDKAINFAEKAVAVYDSIGVIAGLSNSYKILIQSYEDKNALQQALMYEKKYNRIQDSLNTVDKTKSTELIQNYFALNERLNRLAVDEKRNLDNRSRIKAQDAIINTLVFSLLVVVGALSITYYFYRHKKILSKKLREQHEAMFDQKQLIEAQAANLQMVNDLKDKILAVVGHDLRSPIANLHHTLDMFENDILTDKEVHQLMRDITPIVKGAELTLSNLLEWAGSHIKGRAIDITQVDVYPLGIEMEQTFNHLLKSKHIEFVNQASPGQKVLADENHLKVILRNLISNAIKFTGDKGHVLLITSVNDGKLTIAVEDSGRGMSDEEMEKLFHADTHFSQYGTSGELGTGIGLLLCKELVELNGSELFVNSISGKGSKFYFTLTIVN